MKNAKNDSRFDLLILKSSVPDSISLIIFICFAMREVNEITGKNVSRFVCRNFNWEHFLYLQNSSLDATCTDNASGTSAMAVISVNDSDFESLFLQAFSDS